MLVSLVGRKERKIGILFLTYQMRKQVNLKRDFVVVALR